MHWNLQLNLCFNGMARMGNIMEKDGEGKGMGWEGKGTGREGWLDGCLVGWLANAHKYLLII